MIEPLLTGFHYLWSFVVILSVIVFVHEFGHYIVARLVGVKVEVFSIGFGREIWGYTSRRSGTRWKVSLLPFGGYVKMFGDASAASTPDKDAIEQMSAEDRRVSFHHKPLWAKALVVAAGPLANFALTISVFTYFIFTVGLASSEPVVGKVLPNTAAEAAGIQKGDRITRIEGRPIRSFNDISEAVIVNTGTPVTVELERGKTPMRLTLTPRLVADKDSFGNAIKRPLIGLQSRQMTRHDVGIVRALAEATRQTYGLCATSLKAMGQMITGQRGVEDLKGPVGIAKLSGQATQAGDSFSETLRVVLWFIALLSANLGMVNLLPIPVLDGGHLVYYALEALRGKPLAERFQEWSYRTGFALLIVLMGFSLFNDLRQMVF